MSQLTFAEAEYAIKKRTTRREKFLARLEELIPWQKLNSASINAKNIRLALWIGLLLCVLVSGQSWPSQIRWRK